MDGGLVLFQNEKSNRFIKLMKKAQKAFF